MPKPDAGTRPAERAQPQRGLRKALGPDPRLVDLAIVAMAAGDEQPTTRQQVYQLVNEHPGLHLRELARQLDLRTSHAEYHLHQLTKAGLVKTEQTEGYKRYFVAIEPNRELPEGAVQPEDRPWLSLLRQERPLEIVAHLLQEGPGQMGEIADSMDIARSTLSYHVDKLEAQDIVERARRGNQRYVQLSDRERTIRLLVQHQPPEDLVAGFEQLWDDVGL